MPANITVEGQPHRRGAAAGLSHHRCDIGVYEHFHRQCPFGPASVTASVRVTLVDIVVNSQRIVIAMSSVGAKGRVLVPIDVRRAAGFEEGDEVVLRVEEPGRVVMESRQAIRDRVWAAAPEEAAIVPAEVTRGEEVELEERHAAARAEIRGDADEIGRRLLTSLGLD